jgi:hypothetical protein
MNKDELLRKIKRKARADARKRNDPRARRTLGFLVAKGFLRVNYAVPKLPNIRLNVRDAIWAGKNVEGRILEVLPAAMARFGEHFEMNVEEYPNLAEAVRALKAQEAEGQDFYGIPYAKYKVWGDLELPDGRTKKLSEKKVVKTFRMAPEALQALTRLSADWECTETETLERCLCAMRR